MKLEDGYLFVLERDAAKTFFGHRDDQTRLDFIQELLGQDEVVKQSLTGQWQAVHDALAAVEIEDSVLSQCVLGGRPMHQGDDYSVCLVRPDVVQFIADQSKQLASAGLPENVVDLATSTGEIYQEAANRRGAVVFVAKH